MADAADLVDAFLDGAHYELADMERLTVAVPRRVSRRDIVTVIDIANLATTTAAALAGGDGHLASWAVGRVVRFAGFVVMRASTGHLGGRRSGERELGRVVSNDPTEVHELTARAGRVETGEAADVGPLGWSAAVSIQPESTDRWIQAGYGTEVVSWRLVPARAEK